MKSLIIVATLFLAFLSTSYASSCVDLSGHWQVEDVSSDCSPSKKIKKKIDFEFHIPTTGSRMVVSEGNPGEMIIDQDGCDTLRLKVLSEIKSYEHSIFDFSQEEIYAKAISGEAVIQLRQVDEQGQEQSVLYYDVSDSLQKKYKANTKKKKVVYREKGADYITENYLITPTWYFKRVAFKLNKEASELTLVDTTNEGFLFVPMRDRNKCVFKRID